jgi:hypothetical protein
MLMVNSIFAAIITASDVLISIKRVILHSPQTQVSLNSKGPLRQTCFRIAAAHPLKRGGHCRPVKPR